MPPTLSIILPSIRNDKLAGVFESIRNSTKRSFELIIIGPNPLPPELVPYANVKYIRDFGSPIRASQIGTLFAEGEIILWSADDALFLPGALDNNVDLLLSMGSDYKNVVVAKYYEGANASKQEKPLQPDLYFQVNGSSWTDSPFIPKDYWLFNVAIMHKKFFDELGGWDCSYQVCPLSHTDLAIRAQHAGANVVMSEFPLLDCDHGQPDHGPIEYCQSTIDRDIYNNKFKNGPLDNLVACIDRDNWKNAPFIWKPRFGG